MHLPYDSLCKLTTLSPTDFQIFIELFQKGVQEGVYYMLPYQLEKQYSLVDYSREFIELMRN